LVQADRMINTKTTIEMRMVVFFFIAGSWLRL